MGWGEQTWSDAEWAEWAAWNKDTSQFNEPDREPAAAADKPPDAQAQAAQRRCHEDVGDRDSGACSNPHCKRMRADL